MIKKIEDAQLKAEIVTEVLADLPEWFGLPESTQAYIDESRDLPLWSIEVNQKLAGFVTIKETSTATCEIHCMGIKKEFHRQGLGFKLYHSIEHELETKYSFIQVKTVAPGHYKEYDQTNNFYLKCGFKPLEIFPTLWDEWNPCLILVKAL